VLWIDILMVVFTFLNDSSFSGVVFMLKVYRQFYLNTGLICSFYI